MAKIFWVTCPKCNWKFYALSKDFRNTGFQLKCFSCGHRFLDKEAKELKE
jgi:DNA-directed RNA polymerase subunit RPC12/RpoP